jgi:glycosyltransferase involved in cell wall biosynthesis
VKDEIKTVGFLLRSVHCNDGVASHCETLIDALRKNGWRVVIISGAVDYDANSRIRCLKLQSMVAHWEVLDGLNTVTPSLQHIKRCRRLVREHHISMLHGHGFSALPLAAILRLLTGVKCVATFHPSLHGSDPHKMVSQTRRRQQSAKYRFLLTLARPKALIATSLEIRDWLLGEVGMSSSKVIHIPLGIDSDVYREPSAAERVAARRALHVSDDECIFLLAGRLSWNKGHDVLIDAARIVKTRLPTTNFRVFFVGSGDQESEIKEYAFRDDHTASLFTFLGFVEDLPAVYWASDVFVLPSRSEGFGLVVAEAMCTGLLPVRTPGGGARDQIVEGVSGFIFPFDEPEALARIIQNLLEDVQVRHRTAAAAALKGKTLFSKQRMAERTAALYG